MFSIGPVRETLKIKRRYSRFQDDEYHEEELGREEDSKSVSSFELRFKELSQKTQTKPAAAFMPFDLANINVLNDNNSNASRYGKVCKDCQSKYRKNTMKGKAIVPYSPLGTKVELFS